MLLTAVKEFGIEVFPQPTGEILIDMDDLVFYEVAMEKKDDDAYLVTGNQKHYPVRDFIVTPDEMMAIISKQARKNKPPKSHAVLIHFQEMPIVYKIVQL